jgi:hypothetical protein
MCLDIPKPCQPLKRQRLSGRKMKIAPCKGAGSEADWGYIGIGLSDKFLKYVILNLIQDLKKALQIQNLGKK